MIFMGLLASDLKHYNEVVKSIDSDVQNEYESWLCQFLALRVEASYVTLP